MKIFGQEPALVVGAVNALIMVAGTLGFTLLGPDQALLWVALVNAISAAVLAWTTRPLSVGPFAYLFSTIFAAGAAYGFDVGEQTQLAINAGLVPILALLTRGQVSPITTVVTGTTEAPTAEAAEHEFGDVVEDTVADEAAGA